jgi:hypothetical protein
MGFLDLFSKSRKRENEAYLYRMNVVLKCAEKIVGSTSGVSITKYPNGDYGYSGTNFRVMDVIESLTNDFSGQIQDCCYEGISLDKCVETIYRKIIQSDHLEVVSSNKGDSMNNLPSLDFPFIDRNPPYTVADSALMNIVSRLRGMSGITQVYCGYNKIPASSSSSFTTLGNTSLIGFDEYDLKEIFRLHQEPYLCYIAVPIDEADDLIENTSLSDWDFEENVKSVVSAKTVSAGAIFFNNRNVRLRTIKFIMG